LKKFVKFVFIENIDKVEKVYLSADLKKCPRGDFCADTCQFLKDT